MAEFKTVDSYIKLAQANESNGKPFVALDLYRQAFDKATYIASDDAFIPSISVIWSEVNKIGQHAEKDGVVEATVLTLKNRIQETAKSRGIDLN